MELSKALDQIAEIHDQIAKGEVYRGYRPVPVAASGVCGIAAAWLQPYFAGRPAQPDAFLRYWAAAGALCAFVAACGIFTSYVGCEDAFARRRSRRALSQFVPALAAGVALTAAFSTFDPVPAGLLPGLWALLFGAGIFASRPYLPRAAGWIGLYYFVAGTALLLDSDNPAGGAGRWGWSLAATFGIGQLASALMLRFNIERRLPGGEEI